MLGRCLAFLFISIGCPVLNDIDLRYFVDPHRHAVIWRSLIHLTCTRKTCSFGVSPLPDVGRHAAGLSVPFLSSELIAACFFFRCVHTAGLQSIQASIAQIRSCA